MNSLSKDSSDTVIWTKRTGELSQQFEFAEKAAVARIAVLLFNLPQAIKQVGEELEKRKAYESKMKQREESLAGGAGATDYHTGIKLAETLAGRE